MNIELIKETIVPFITTYSVKLAGALAVWIIGAILVKMILKIVSKGFKKKQTEPTVSNFMLSLLKFMLNLVLLIIVGTMLGVQMSSLVAVLGAAGLAIGLALQGSLSNFAGGIILLVLKPFKVGDYIKANGLEGSVKSLAILFTTLETVDKKTVYIPNGSLANAPITNFSVSENRRVDLVFSTSYDNDIDKVKAIITEVAVAHPKVLKDPEPFIRLSAHNSSSLDYTCRLWVKGVDYWTVHFDLLEQVKKAFDANDIEIPYPQIVVHQDK